MAAIRHLGFLNSKFFKRPILRHQTKFCGDRSNELNKLEARQSMSVARLAIPLAAC